VLPAIRREIKVRQDIARRVLPAENLYTDSEGFHVWLTLPAPWNRAEFTTRPRSMGIAIVASDAFAVGTAPEAVRLGLGAPAARDQFEQRLHVVSDLLGQSPAMSTMVI
jgi:DNA-binding transcriptional MocR family regulator